MTKQTTPFLDIDLFKELGIDALPQERQDALLEQMGTVLMQTIVARMLPMLNEEDQKAFEAMFETSNDIDSVRVFLSQRIPEFHSIVQEEVATFKKEALDFYRALA